MRKNLLLTSLTVMMAFLSLTSCDNEPLGDGFPEDITPNPGVEANFQVDIDSVTFVADQAKVITENGVTVISGVKNIGTAVIMTVNGSGTGTYALGSAEGGTAGYTVQGETPYVIDAEASGNILKITQYDVANGLASGTFSFTVTHTIEDENGEDVTETVELTNGKFENVQLESDEAPEPPQGDSNFEVKLDGELFEGQEIADAVLNEDGLLIRATNGNKQIGFQIFNPAVGTFNLTDGQDGFVIYDLDNTNDESTLYQSASGTIEVTSIDMENGIITGTFNGVLKDIFQEEPDIEMTDGIFQNIQFSTDAPTNVGTALIDGEDFNANVFPVAFVNNQIQVNLDNDLNKVIRLLLPEDITVGTFPVVDNQMAADYSASYEVDDSEGNTTAYGSVADSGEIVITSFENEIVSGTFQFDVKNSNGETISITQGEFTVDVSF